MAISHHFYCTMYYNVLTFEISGFVFFCGVKVCFRGFFIEEIDSSLSSDQPPSVVYTGSVKMWRYLPVSKVSSDKNIAPPRNTKIQIQGNFLRSGKLAIHGCKMTGRVI